MKSYCKLVDGPCGEDCENCAELLRRKQTFMCEYHQDIKCPFPTSDCTNWLLFPDDDG